MELCNEAVHIPCPANYRTFAAPAASKTKKAPAIFTIVSNNVFQRSVHVLQLKEKRLKKQRTGEDCPKNSGADAALQPFKPASGAGPDRSHLEGKPQSLYQLDPRAACLVLSQISLYRETRLQSAANGTPAWPGG